MSFVRYGIGGTLIFVGVLFLCFGSHDIRYEGFGLCAGAGLALLLFSALIRLNAGADKDREAEEAARDYFSEHGRWPGDDA